MNTKIGAAFIHSLTRCHDTLLFPIAVHTLAELFNISWGKISRDKTSHYKDFFFRLKTCQMKNSNSKKKVKIRIRRKTGAKTDIYLHKGFRRYFAAAYEQMSH